MNRHATRLIALGVLAVAGTVLPAGCSSPRSGSLGPGPTVRTPSPSVPSSLGPAGSPTATTGPSRNPSTPVSAHPSDTGASGTGDTVTVQLWFTRDGRIVPTARTRPATVATSRLALNELAAGPSDGEAATGLDTLVPTGAEATRIADGTATVRVPPAFDSGDAAVVRLRRAQVVYTLTQFPSVRRVRFEPADPSGGAPADPSGGAPGGPETTPVGRGDYADLLPPVVVTAPTIGQRVSSPVTVTGTADVFEATVSVRLLDSAGREIATGFTTATCGTGCRGDYRITLAYRLATGSPGTVEVFEVSPVDGSRIHLAAVPVVFAASR